MEYIIYHQFFLIPEENAYIHRVTIGTIWAEEPFWGRKARRKSTDHSITSWVTNGDPAYHTQILSNQISQHGTGKNAMEYDRNTLRY